MCYVLRKNFTWHDSDQLKSQNTWKAMEWMQIMMSYISQIYNTSILSKMIYLAFFRHCDI